jgi:TPR repeat protein
MSSTAENTVVTCANCGKGEECAGNLKACTACKVVKYCNRDCQIAHRPQHKKACKKQAAELYDHELFKDPPSQFDDCPICTLPMPAMSTGRQYKECCGQMVCMGCLHAVGIRAQSNGKLIKCPFCRTPGAYTAKDSNERIKKRIELGDAFSTFQLADCYDGGTNGFAQDFDKSFELYLRAGELGCADAYCSVGCAYDNGHGVEQDKKKAKYYFELAAMKGCTYSRFNLGNAEGRAGNWDRALKHFILAAGGGDNDALEKIKVFFMHGRATKEDYAKALRLYQARLAEIKSSQRDEAAAALGDQCRYY